MSQERVVKRIYLTVEVEEPWLAPKPGDWAKRGRELRGKVADLLRASGLDGLGDVGCEVEVVEECTFCRNVYEEDTDGPICCDAALADWKANYAKVDHHV